MSITVKFSNAATPQVVLSDILPGQLFYFVEDKSMEVCLRTNGRRYVTVSTGGLHSADRVHYSMAVLLKGTLTVEEQK